MMEVLYVELPLCEDDITRRYMGFIHGDLYMLIDQGPQGSNIEIMLVTYLAEQSFVQSSTHAKLQCLNVSNNSHQAFFHVAS